MKRWKLLKGIFSGLLILIFSLKVTGQLSITGQLRPRSETSQWYGNIEAQGKSSRFFCFTASSSHF